MELLENIHPGEILNEEFLKDLNVSAYKLASETEIPQSRISQIIKGKRSITADTALRLSIYFGTTATFWLGLQQHGCLFSDRAGQIHKLRIHILTGIGIVCFLKFTI